LYVADSPTVKRFVAAFFRLDFILVLNKLSRDDMATPDPAVLAAIASPRRREILRLLWDGEQSAGSIRDAMPDVTFGAVSLQLRVLSDAGLVTSRAEGRQRFYTVRRERLGDVGRVLESMWADALWKLKLHAEFEASRRGPRPRRRKESRPS
jgi:DNA-binding transcriptional ArsR family regulator